MKSMYKNKLLILAVIIMIACTVFFAVQDIVLSGIAYADKSSYDLDDTYVLDDLQSSKVDGKSFDVRKYPRNENGKISIINFVEYCYSYHSNNRQNYALYIYIYNPTEAEINVQSSQNKIQFGVEYNDEDNPVRYEKFNLIFCNKSTGDTNNRFLKFRVADTAINGTKFADRVKSDARKYDISGIELLKAGDRNATEYGIGGSYVFTGYAEGYGPNGKEPSTLACTAKDLETLSLKVYHTNYRTGMSNAGRDHYNNIDTVYFSVPDRIFQTYGNLQKIHAEWWEYKLKPVIVSDNADFVNLVNKDYKYGNVGKFNPGIAGQSSGLGKGYLLYNKSIPFAFMTQSSIDEYGWCFNTYPCLLNVPIDKLTPPEIVQFERYNILGNVPLTFYSENTEDSDNVFSFLYNYYKAGTVSSSMLANAIFEYSKASVDEFIDCNGRELSSVLFENHVDSGRTLGYNNVNIDFDDTFDLKSYDSNHSWIVKLLSMGISTPDTSEEYKNVRPIYEVKSSDLVGTTESISSRLLINKNCVSELQSFYAQETLKGNHVILFRFANTDYYCTQSSVISNVKGNELGIVAGSAYMARQTVFFDFDIIDLTFNKEGQYHVIPAVSSPMDIVNDITPPPAVLDWIKVLIFCLIVLVGILLLIFVVWIIVSLIKLFKPAQKVKIQTSESNKSKRIKKTKSPKRRKPKKSKK